MASNLNEILDNCSTVYLIEPKKNLANMAKLEGVKLDQNNETYSFCYSDLFNSFINDSVHPNDREHVSGLMNVDNLINTFKNNKEDKIEFVYRSKYNVVVRCLVECIDDNDSLKLVAGLKENIQETNEDVFADFDELEIFRALSKNFSNVYVADINKGVAKILKYNTKYLNYLNMDAYNIFPYENILNRWIETDVYKDDQEMIRKELSVNNLRKVFKDNDEFTGTYRSFANNRILNYQFYLIKINEQGGIIAAFQNIDQIIEEHLLEEEKQRQKEEAYQKELIKAKQEAESANKAKTEFLQRMSHDVRTPLNGIRGMLEIAEKYSDDLDKQKECRAKIREASDLLLELINEVLDMSKLESGNITFEEVPFDIVKLSLEIYNIIIRQAEDRGIEIVQKECKVAHHKLIGSPVHFKRMMMNILSNAIKYNKENGKIYITCKEVKYDGKTAIIEFKCKDTGIGMSNEYQKHIFEPFSQENELIKSKYNGTGLGMPITKNIVEKMGGSISFTSEKDVGTTFDVLIPFKINKQADITNRDDAPVLNSLEGLNILLAEDNDLNMEIASFVLNEGGANVIKASNGKEAIELFEKSNIGYFDVVLLDVMMPVLNGLDACKYIRSLDRKDNDLPIIAMTANAFVEDKIKAKEAGMNEHISKPLDSKKVKRTITKLVHEYRNRD